MENRFLERNRDKEETPVKENFRTIRQWLNIIFMVCAIIGVALYVMHTPQSTGIIVVLVAMVFKIIECALRFIK